jgi:hypothetical protein
MQDTTRGETQSYSMEERIVLASLSPVKLAAARAVFGPRVEGVAATVPFNPPQPVGDEYGLVCACMRLEATPGAAVLAVESYLRQEDSGEWVDVVCAVLRRCGRVWGETGGAISVPRAAAEAAQKAPGGTAAGFGETAGMHLVSLGLAKNAASWQGELSSVSREQQIAGVLRALAAAGPLRCSGMDLRANLRYTPDFPKPGVLFKVRNSEGSRWLCG